jgi:hypothetical protein
MIEGFRENFFIFADAEYRRPEFSGFARDHANLCGDATRVAADLKRNMRRVETESLCPDVSLSRP